MAYDDIVVGGGSAGAVLAARLSQDSHRSVLLIEAGPDYDGIEHTPASLLDGQQLARDHDWGFTAEMVPGPFAALSPRQGDGRMLECERLLGSAGRTSGLRRMGGTRKYRVELAQDAAAFH